MRWLFCFSTYLGRLDVSGGVLLFLVVLGARNFFGGIVHKAKGTIVNIGKYGITTFFQRVTKSRLNFLVNRGNLRFGGWVVATVGMGCSMPKEQERIDGIVVRIRNHGHDLKFTYRISKLSNGYVVGFQKGNFYELYSILWRVFPETKYGNLRTCLPMVPGFVDGLFCETGRERSGVLHDEEGTIRDFEIRGHSRGK